MSYLPDPPPGTIIAQEQMFLYNRNPTRPLQKFKEQMKFIDCKGQVFEYHVQTKTLVYQYSARFEG